MAIAIYARKSTESEDRQVQSLDDQISALENLAKREALDVAEVFVESKSAKTPYARPEFQRLIGKIERGEIDGILTWAINRLSRNLVDGGIVTHLLQTSKLKFIRTPERTYRPEDNVLILSIENGMATSFLQDLSRNVKRGMKGKAERGWMPGKAPLGYINNLATHEIALDPNRFELVKKGWRLILSGGYTLPEIRDELTRLGLRGVHKDKPIAKSLLYRTLSNPFYAGYFMYQGQLLRGKHAPMVTMAEFEVVQQLLGRVPGRRQHKHAFIYSGLLRCKTCGCLNVAETKTKRYGSTGRTVSYTYYHCSGAKGCSKRGLREDHLSDAIDRAMNGVTVRKEFEDLVKVALLHIGEQDTVAIAQSIGQLDHEIQRLETRIGRIRELRVDSELSSQEFAHLRAEAEMQIGELRRTRQEASTEDERINNYVLKKIAVQRQASEYDLLSVPEKRGLILSIGPQHYLTLGKLEFNIDPIIKKIAGFEPLRDGSQIPKPSDFLPSNSRWLGLVYALRKIARKQLATEGGTNHVLAG